MPRGHCWGRTNSRLRTPWGTCSPCPGSVPLWWGAAPPPRWTTMYAWPGGSPPSTPNTYAGWKRGPSGMRLRVPPIRSRRERPWLPRLPPADNSVVFFGIPTSFFDTPHKSCDNGEKVIEDTPDDSTLTTHHSGFRRAGVCLVNSTWTRLRDSPREERHHHD